jgi:hypothetical protein
MSRFYEIHAAAISRACADVRPGEMFRIIMLEPLPVLGPEMSATAEDTFANLITFRRAYDGHGCFVVDGHKLIEEFNERHRTRAPAAWDMPALPNIDAEIKAATAEMQTVCGMKPLPVQTEGT